MEVDMLEEKAKLRAKPVFQAGFRALFVQRRYAAPNLTDTSFDTPGSCIVTP